MGSRPGGRGGGALTTADVTLADQADRKPYPGCFSVWAVGFGLLEYLWKEWNLIVAKAQRILASWQDGPRPTVGNSSSNTVN